MAQTSEPKPVKTAASSKNLPTIPKSPSTKYNPVVIENYKHLTRDGSVVDYSLSDDEEHYPNPHANIVGGSELQLGPSHGMPDEIPFLVGDGGIDGANGLGGVDGAVDESAKNAALEREKEREREREQREKERAQALAQRQAETQAFIHKVLDFENYLAFEAELAVPRTVLLLGKAGAGKTSLLNLLTKSQVKSSPPTFFAGQPRVPEVHCYTFRSQVDKSLPNYYMSIVDTPGVREVTNRLKDRKTSDEVTQILQDYLATSLPLISAIFVLVPLGVIREPDLGYLASLKKLVREGLRRNTFLVFTHADEYRQETLHEILKSFLESEVAASYMDLCRGGIKLSGLVNSEMCAEFGKVYEDNATKKVFAFRDSLIKTIIAQDTIKQSDSTSKSQREVSNEKKVADKLVKNSSRANKK